MCRSAVIKCAVVSSAMHSHGMSVCAAYRLWAHARSRGFVCLGAHKDGRGSPPWRGEGCRGNLDQGDPDTRHCVTDAVFAGSFAASALVGGCRLSQPRAGAKTISKNVMSRWDTCWLALAL